MKKKQKAASDSPFHISLRAYFALLTLAELLLTLLISTITAELLNLRLSSFHPLVWVVIIGVVIGVCLSIGFNQLLLFPIMRLCRSMQQVAKGDFSVRLDTSVPVKEIQTTYANFNTMTEALSSIETLQSDFISNVSHEFKTPLSALEGYATLLQGASTQQETEKYIHSILMNTRRLSHLVANILLLSKVESRAIRPKPQPFRLDEQIRQSIVLLESRWAAKDIEIDVDDMPDISYAGTEQLMQHVWINLLSNAIKFTPEGGMITIRLMDEGEQLRITVSDTGCGIPAGEEEKIFQRFYQSDSSHKQEGNGLGLPLCRRIVELQGGTITAGSNTDSPGACFTVTLPVNSQ